MVPTPTFPPGVMLNKVLVPRLLIVEIPKFPVAACPVNQEVVVFLNSIPTFELAVDLVMVKGVDVVPKTSSKLPGLVVPIPTLPVAGNVFCA